MVMDARTGKVLHSRNADTKLHPASLTKMMTLYVAFEAIRNGEITLDTRVRVSQNAAAEVPSKIWLKAGQRIELRYLIRASAVKSANDAATAIAEAIEGSEAAFARRMTRTARALGMRNTTFRNAHGLTQAGHLSTARDMTILGRHLFYDYPEYYNLFSRRSTDVKVTTVANTNRRLLNAYKGADGIKTGYTRAAGSNLVASAERGSVRIIATMFGGTSSAARNARVAELLDMGFARAPRRVAETPPKRPNPALSRGSSMTLVASAIPAVRPPSVIARAEAERLGDVAVASAEPVAETTDLALDASAAAADSAAVAVAAAVAATLVQELEETPESLAALPDAAAKPVATDATDPGADAPELVTMRRDVQDTLASLVPESGAPVEADVAALAPLIPRPQRRPARVTFSTADTPMAPTAAKDGSIVVSTRNAANGNWGVRVGRYNTRGQAERMLLRTALQQVDLLSGARRQVVSRPRGWEVEFVGLSRQAAQLACQRLSARDERCAPFGS